ncbi:unnamed protein product [Acanthoscelides obtectus]|uniref:Uncharacterized protein n=1 Tax=Acanthoscelides obtectus TaxID=200917 RepID=A0A9P0L274_ACAOB|nr:unnamed protein product [Acanthoscelides obtectus]CAK1652919.1 hypothetical protein AOBTE_LOCUS17968 [Acanthoscelides obtectus]
MSIIYVHQSITGVSHHRNTIKTGEPLQLKAILQEFSRSQDPKEKGQFVVRPYEVVRTVAQASVTTRLMLLICNGRYYFILREFKSNYKADFIKYGTVCVSSGVQLSLMLSERTSTSTTSWNKSGHVAQERRDFIKYALAKGYERDAGNKQEGIPEAFSNILRFYRTQNLTPAHMSQGLQEIVCFPWGCIDINDPSVYP